MAGAAAGSSASSSATRRAPPLDNAIIFQYVKADNVSDLTGFCGNPHTVDKAGFNAMMVAAKYRRPLALKWCIENGVGRAGVDKEERKEGLTSLMLACLRWSLPNPTGLPPIEQDSAECARILIRAGANPMKQDLSGKTCAHHAALAGLPRIIVFLCGISEGPELMTMKDSAGVAPADLVREKFAAAVPVPRPVVTKKPGEPGTAVEVEGEGVPSANSALHEAATRVQEVCRARGPALPPGSPAPVPVVPLRNAACFGCAVRVQEPKIKLKKKDSTGDVIVEVPIGDYLASAARRGDIITLERFSGYLDHVDSDGRTVVHSACVAREIAVLAWVVGKFRLVGDAKLESMISQADDYGCTALHFCAAGGKKDTQPSAKCAKFVLANGGGACINAVDNAGFTPLHIAAQNGYPKIVRALLRAPNADAFAYVDGQDALKLTSDDRCRALLKAFQELSTEARCVMEGDIAALSRVPASFQRKQLTAGLTLPRFAARLCREDVLKFYLAKMSRDDILKIPKGSNLSLLHLVCDKHSEPEPLLFGRREYAQLACVRAIMNTEGGKLSVNLQTRDREYTALHMAAEGGLCLVVKELLNNDANRFLRNKEGKLPADLTKTPEILDLLAQSTLPAKAKTPGKPRHAAEKKQTEQRRHLDAVAQHAELEHALAVQVRAAEATVAGMNAVHGVGRQLGAARAVLCQVADSKVLEEEFGARCGLAELWGNRDWASWALGLKAAAVNTWEWTYCGATPAPAPPPTESWLQCSAWLTETELLEPQRVSSTGGPLTKEQLRVADIKVVETQPYFFKATLNPKFLAGDPAVAKAVVLGKFALSGHRVQVASVSTVQLECYSLGRHCTVAEDVPASKFSPVAALTVIHAKGWQPGVVLPIKAWMGTELGLPTQAPDPDIPDTHLDFGGVGKPTMSDRRSVLQYVYMAVPWFDRHLGQVLGGSRVEDECVVASAIQMVHTLHAVLRAGVQHMGPKLETWKVVAAPTTRLAWSCRVVLTGFQDCTVCPEEELVHSLGLRVDKPQEPRRRDPPGPGSVLAFVVDATCAMETTPGHVTRQLERLGAFVTQCCWEDLQSSWVSFTEVLAAAPGATVLFVYCGNVCNKGGVTCFAPWDTKVGPEVPVYALDPLLKLVKVPFSLVVVVDALRPGRQAEVVRTVNLCVEHSPLTCMWATATAIAKTTEEPSAVTETPFGAAFVGALAAHTIAGSLKTLMDDIRANLKGQKLSSFTEDDLDAMSIVDPSEKLNQGAGAGAGAGAAQDPAPPIPNPVYWKPPNFGVDLHTVCQELQPFVDPRVEGLEGASVITPIQALAALICSGTGASSRVHWLPPRAMWNVLCAAQFLGVGVGQVGPTDCARFKRQAMFSTKTHEDVLAFHQLTFALEMDAEEARAHLRDVVEDWVMCRTPGRLDGGYTILPAGSVSVMGVEFGRGACACVVKGVTAQSVFGGDPDIRAVKTFHVLESPGVSTQELTDECVARALYDVDKEARMLGVCNSPHVQRLFGVMDTPRSGVPRLVLEAHATSLAQVCGSDAGDPARTQVVTPALVRGVLEGLLAALVHLAELPHPLVHCDIKEDNVLLRAGPWLTPDLARQAVVLTDFGCARVVLACDSVLAVPPRGAVAYQAPEASTGAVDGRADVYSVCLMLCNVVCHTVAKRQGSVVWRDCPLPALSGEVVKEACRVLWGDAPVLATALERGCTVAVADRPCAAELHRSLCGV